MSDGIRFLEYCYVMYFSDPKFLLDGSMFKYCLQREKDHFIYISLLRLLSCLPESIPHLAEIENKAFNSNKLNYFESFKLFEYKTLKKRRSVNIDPEDLEYYKIMATAIRKFFELINSCVPLIQHVYKRNYFYFGTSLSELERKVEFYVELMLIKHPNKPLFMKLANIFYERCAMDPAKAESLEKQIKLCNVYQSENPLWREMCTQKVFFNQKYEFLSDSKENLLSQEPQEVSTASLKSAISNDMFRLESKHLRFLEYVNISIIVLFVGYVACIIFATASFDTNASGLMNLSTAVNDKQTSFCELMINSLRPCRGVLDTAEMRSQIQTFIDGYFVEHALFYKNLNNILSTSALLNNSLWSLFADRYLASSALDGTEFNYSYVTIGTRVATATETVLGAPQCNASQYYYLTQMLFLNMTDWFGIFTGKFNPLLAYISNEVRLKYVMFGDLATVFIYVAGLILLISLIFYRIKLHKITNSFSEGVPNKESNIIQKIISGNQKGYLFYTYIILFLIAITIIMYIFLMHLMQYDVQNQIIYLMAALSDIFREIIQLFYISTGITCLRIYLLNHTQYPLAAYGIETTLYVLMGLDRSHSNNYPLIDNMSQLISSSYHAINEEETMNFTNQAADIFLDQLIPSNNEYITNRYTAYYKDKNEVTFNHVGIHSWIFLLAAVFVSIISIYFFEFVHSILYTKMITQLIPYVRTAVSEDGSNTVTGMNENSFSLDLIGYPAAIIDSSDEIIFVNHLWLTDFNGVMSNFIGENYQNINEEFSVCPHVQDGLRVIVIEKSREMEDLRKNISSKDSDYKSMIQVLHPLESFTPEMKERDAIVLCLIFTSFNEGDKTSETDSCFYEVRYIISEVKEFTAEFNPRFLTWSFGEIQIVFGLNDDDTSLMDSALSALNTAFFAIQKALEFEDIYEMSVAAVLMKGKFNNCMFDGYGARQNRQPNAVIVSPAVSDLLTDYICDLAFVVNDFVTIYVDPRDIKYLADDEEECDSDEAFVCL
ncbi:hypothetical protein TVAG_072020 [Trichomonas vaginalis G3]|uniref:Uncharacterized protein n=1 Tax=Trichomonas vaginalis (strain ATCC PRA-98 / G3) TaxID=412133 RepID=A2D8A6_TRIV3|nr:hypothetical protein TVAGG3_1047240 [Trichomonas vaginalis G3]EAY23539.1 hypothetical protein TVAG_072020 [Trichomonas vaginalis G3]KAI5493961.1 hypothetical protein TVAGG3_1047240 [Trichomonas vaginalis G3]|eukprot:XP_001584525.1 hypothetical protein [Trichomonas vaginalis G3]